MELIELSVLFSLITTVFIMSFLGVIWFRISKFEAELSKASRHVKLDAEMMSPFMDEIEARILETISEMRQPTAIDHIAGVWSNIMMMREQVKMAKAGLIAPQENDS